MEKKKHIQKQLDAAIDRMDMEAIEQELQALSALEQDPIQPEDPALFAARICRIEKERTPMKNTKSTLRIALVVAVVALLSVGVYAANAMNLFSFMSEDRLVTVRSTESMTEQEAQALASEDSGEPENLPPEARGTADITEYDFDSVEQAAAKMDMQLVLPDSMPDLPLESASGQSIAFGDSAETRTVWLSYVGDNGQMFGITTTREIVAPGSSVTGITSGDMDPGSGGSYRSKSGAEYITATESDESGELVAHIAVATAGEYEYVLVFVGFDQAEREAIIDSADLSVY